MGIVLMLILVIQILAILLGIGIGIIILVIISKIKSKKNSTYPTAGIVLGILISSALILPKLYFLFVGLEDLASYLHHEIEPQISYSTLIFYGALLVVLGYLITVIYTLASNWINENKN